MARLLLYAMHNLCDFKSFVLFLFLYLTQNFFLIARMLSSFCDIRDKSAVFNILRQNETIFDIGNG